MKIPRPLVCAHAFVERHSPKVVAVALLAGVVKLGLVFGGVGIAIVLVLTTLLVDFDWEVL